MAVPHPPPAWPQEPMTSTAPLPSRGDDNGPFDEQTVKERRAELQADKETARRKQERTRKAAAVDEAPWEEEDLEELEDF